MHLPEPDAERLAKKDVAVKALLGVPSRDCVLSKPEELIAYECDGGLDPFPWTV